MIIRDLSWLAGSRLVTAEKSDLTWAFVFSGEGRIWTESPWRLIAHDLIQTTSADHGERFGAEERVDASARVLAAVRGRAVLRYSIAPRTADLQLEFADGVTLEFLSLSSGHESWRAAQGDHNVHCVGGGHLAVWSPPAGESVA